MDEGYCESDSYYYQYVTFYCVRTCSGHPTDKYLNCKSLAKSGYCPYYFSNGEKVIEGCPDSCDQFDRHQSTTATKKQSLKKDTDGGHPALQPMSGPFAGPIAPEPMLPKKTKPPSATPPEEGAGPKATDSGKLAAAGPNAVVAHLQWRGGNAKPRGDSLTRSETVDK